MLDDSVSVLNQQLKMDPLRLSLRFDGQDSLEIDMRMESGEDTLITVALRDCTSLYCTVHSYLGSEDISR